MDVDGEHHDLDVGYILILEHLELLIVLILQSRRELGCILLDPLFEVLDELIRTVGECLDWEEGNSGASQRYRKAILSTESQSATWGMENKCNK